MNQFVGIVRGKPGWIKILQQEGVRYKLFERGDNPVVLIVDEIVDKKAIREYVNEGGCLLTETELLSELFGFQVKSTKVNSIIPDGSEIFRDTGIIDVYQRGCILKSEGFGTINSKYPAVFDFSFKKGWGIALPFDVSLAILDYSSRMKYFFNEFGNFPTENVASVSKGGVRRLVVNCLRFLFKKRGAYYFHKWYFPQRKRNCFLFRIDTDTSDLEEILTTYRTVAEKNVSLSFYVFVKEIQESLSRLAELRNQEVGVHCFEHKIYKDPLKNKENFLRAKDYLEKHGFSVKGIVTPYGVWNEPIGFAIEEIGFHYSSEFSYSYDDIPSFPYLTTRFSSVLQIPVHPISPGALLYVKNSVEDIKKYYTKVMEKKYRMNEPLFFYGHSSVISKHPDILENIIRVYKEKKDVWTGTFFEFSKFWRKRGSLTLEIERTDTKVTVRSEDRNGDLSVRVINPKEEFAIVPVNETFNLSDLKFEKFSPVEPFDRGMLKTKQGRLKLRFKEIENWIQR
jgi:hypothetical protein